MSTTDVVWTLAFETKACCDLVDNGRIDWKHVPPPENVDEIGAAFEQHYAALDERVAKLDDEGWQKKGQLLVDGKLMREAPVGEFLW